jgi:hypothetical protein
MKEEGTPISPQFPFSIEVHDHVPASTHAVTMLVKPEALQQVQVAVAAHQVSTAAWGGYAMYQVTREDFPASWRVGEPPVDRMHPPSFRGGSCCALMRTPLARERR